MRITEVKMRKIDKGNIKAVASIVIDDAFIVHDFKVMESKNGLFVSMPSKKIGDKYIDTSHPIGSDSKSMINLLVLEEYQKIC